ncbi:MAG: hypothetical protein IT374_22255 [Polyangiaceae bacterium]|nr:hypothetical protein [Polyangiaceae bacterium]
MTAPRAALAISVVAGIAWGTPPRAGALPTAQLPPLPAPSSRPGSIPAGASVPGIRISGPAGGAVAVSKSHRAPPVPGTSMEVTSDAGDDACLAIAQPGRDAFRSTSAIFDRSEGVVPVRVETLRDAGGVATLTVLDLWVDPLTLGVARAGRVELPLARIADSALGAVVFGFRASDSVHLVVPASQSGQVQTSEGQLISTSCATLRIDLAAARGKAAVVTGSFMKQTPAVPATETEPAVAPVAVRFGLAATLSQTSRDPEPVLSVVLRPLDELPAPPRQSKR